MHWRRKWQPTPVFLPGESQGREAWWAAISGVAQSRTRLKLHSSSSRNVLGFLCSSVQLLSHVCLFQPHGLQHIRLPVYHQLPELTQTHVHRVSDAIQPSHPLSFPSPPAFNLFQHQGLSNESVLHIRWPNIGVSASASVLPMNIQDWFSLGWTGWISLQSKELSRVFSNPTAQKHLWHSAFFIVQLSHPYMTTGKTIALTRQTFVGKVMSLLFNMLSRY